MVSFHMDGHIYYVTVYAKTNQLSAKIAIFDEYPNYFAVSTLIANMESFAQKMAEIQLLISHTTYKVIIAIQ